MTRGEKTVLRSIRLPASLEGSLVKEADSRKMSVNSFIASILAKYDEWDRVAEKFGFVQLPSDNLRAILQVTEEQALVRSAREQGAKVPRQVINFWFRSVSHTTFLSYLTLYSNYGRLMEYQVSQSGREVTISTHHRLGAKWSLWMRNYLAEAIRAIYGVSPETEATEDTVNFRYVLP